MAESNVRLKVDGSNAVNELNRVNRAAGKTERGVQGLSGAVTKLVGAFATVKTAQFVFFKTAELETQTRSLQVLTGSLNDTKKIVSELQAFGNVTPFTSSDLIETAKRLKAFGFETERIVDVTKRLGDVAGATGADLSGIATAFGQIQAKGRLQGEELLQLQERGVDLQGTLRQEYNLTAEEFQKALSSGRISADAVSFALEKLTEAGGKYADGAIAQSDTLNGKLSTLTDNIDVLARTIGNVLSPVIKGIFDDAIEALSAVNRLIAAGRQGGFNRSIGGIATAMTFGATSEGVDRAARLLPQVTPQNNREGIEQNLQVLKQISQQLQRVGANDRNASRAVGLQGRVMSLQNQNLAALNNLPAETMEVRELPALGVGTRGGSGGGRSRGGAGSKTKERIDASQKILDLTRELFEVEAPISELQEISLKFQIEKQKILERNLLPREEEIALLKAQGKFEDDLIRVHEDRLKIQQQEMQEAEDLQKKIQEAQQAQLDKNPYIQMQKEFEKLLDLEMQVASGAKAIGSAFSNAFTQTISGSKSAEEALADMLASVAEHFLDMAAQIIAQQIAMIVYGTIMKALGVSLPGAGGGNMGGQNYFDPTTGKGVAGPNFGLAEGGYVSSPTNALIGEGGEPEYVIPESKMRESMSRYSGGARGASVIPKGPAGVKSNAGGEMGGGGGGEIDIRYNVERINNVDYVTNEEFQRGIRQAAVTGAAQGEKRTLATLKQNTAQRKRLGI